MECVSGRTTTMTAENMSAATKDPEVEAWAEVVEDLLYRVPPEKRAAVLEEATRKEAAARKEREADGGFRIMQFDKKSMDEFMASPGMRHWNRIMRLKSEIVYTFTR